ncbi:UNKNOWN [Stylonychia lemnae]|uniref:Uncharacterized protein n=1 Tax=Stylonychia lemnae TaxID=5949 RepID=A0A078AHN3_STYLE|nr:UNKNOWN [Stylonychia lemnae]|eukprot:CDW80338.1 UNKNOWN [Stylonychia lemnae]
MQGTSPNNLSVTQRAQAIKIVQVQPKQNSDSSSSIKFTQTALGDIYTAETINDVDVEEERGFSSRLGSINKLDNAASNYKNFFQNCEDEKERVLDKETDDYQNEENEVRQLQQYNDQLTVACYNQQQQISSLKASSMFSDIKYKSQDKRLTVNVRSIQARKEYDSKNSQIFSKLTPLTVNSEKYQSERQSFTRPPTNLRRNIFDQSQHSQLLRTQSSHDEQVFQKVQLPEGFKVNSQEDDFSYGTPIVTYVNNTIANTPVKIQVNQNMQSFNVKQQNQISVEKKLQPFSSTVVREESQNKSSFCRISHLKQIAGDEDCDNVSIHSKSLSRDKNQSSLNTYQKDKKEYDIDVDMDLEDLRSTPIIIQDVLQMSTATKNQLSISQKINKLNQSHRGKQEFNFSRIENKHLIENKKIIQQVKYKTDKNLLINAWFSIDKKFIKIAKNKAITDLILSVNYHRTCVTVKQIGQSTIQICAQDFENFEIVVLNGDTLHKILDNLKIYLSQAKFSKKIQNRYTDFKLSIQKQTRVSLEQFREIADTGDIIFFKGKTMGCKVQRFFTRCDFDHVALILKYKCGTLVLFESTGTACNRGKKYRLNAIDLLKSEQNGEEQEQEGFFCSELVAAAYQSLGLLPKSKLPSTFWPSTLADENLKLEDGITLSKLIAIDYQNIPTKL